MGIVDQAIEDGVGLGRIADDFVPDGYRQLAGDDRRAAAVTLLEDFQRWNPTNSRSCSVSAAQPIFTQIDTTAAHRSALSRS
jgi:hypothetical protein